MKARSRCWSRLVAGLLAAGSGLVAQGPLYRESWAFLALDRLRGQVATELVGRDAESVAMVASTLAAPDQGNPFRGPAQALARLRSAACDDAFLYRAMLGAFVLPEVVDPVGGNTECRSAAVSVFVPYTVPQPGKVAFTVRLLDADGKELQVAVIDRDTDMPDVRMARSAVRLAMQDLPDGRYEVRVRTSFDGKPGAATDPELRMPVLVQRGWQARAEAAMATTAQVAKELPEPQQSLLVGAAAEVSRVYRGEPWAVAPQAVHDLEVLEQMLANVAGKQSLWTGVQGEVCGSILVGKDERGGSQRLGFALRLPAAAGPLLVVAGGAPAYDVADNRPLAPGSHAPRWALAAGAAFAPEGALLVGIESPGNGVPYSQALLQTLEVLGQLLPVQGKPVLVAEREAALAATLTLPGLGQRLRGLALVAGGALSRPVLQQLGDLPVLALPARGHRSSDALRLAAEALAGKFGPLQPKPKLRIAEDSCMPWILGLSSGAPELRAFLRQVLDG